MDGRFPKGMHFVLTNCKSPAREEEFNRWYNLTHLSDITGTGAVGNARRYQALAPGDAKYLATYETDGDPAEALRQVRANAERLRQRGRMNDDLVRVLSQTFRAVAFWRRGQGQPVTGLLVVGSNCKAPERVKEFNDWYTNVHLPDILATGLFHTGYRYQNIDPQPGQFRYLALYETDLSDPLRATEELLAFRPRWDAQGRRSPDLEVTYRGVFRPIWPPTR